MEQTLVFCDSSFDKNNPYNPWEKMDEAIKNYRRNEESEALVFSSNPNENFKIKIDLEKIIKENRE